ncbi:MAG: PAS domain S-box protein [Terriglobia bacterium]
MSRQHSEHSSKQSAGSASLDLSGLARTSFPTPLGSGRSTILAFVIGATLVSAFTIFLISRSYQSELEYWIDRQSSVADERAGAVTSFLVERQADADVLGVLPAIEAFTEHPATAKALPQNSPPARQLVDFLDRFSSVYSYRGIYVVDASGKELSRSSGAADPDPDAQSLVRQVVQERSPRIDLLGRSSAGGILAICVPILRKAEGEDPSQPPKHELGAVLLEMSATRNLFPLLTARLLPTRTGETFLIRRQGRDAVYLSPLRSVAQGLEFPRHSLDVDPPAARALDLGDYAGVETDYRGEPVIIATRRIPQTGWGLVRKIDRSEALGPFYRRAVIEGSLGLLIILVYGAILTGYWRGQQARSLQAKVDEQQRLLKVTEYAQEIVDTVPSGLLVLSEDMRVLSANRHFLEFSRLQSNDVVGRRLDEVIQAEGPPYRVEGLSVTGVPTQSVLLNVSVAGREEKLPARIAITSILHPEGEGRMLVVMEDQTESERLRASAEASERRLRDLIQSVDAIVWEADAAPFQMTFVSRRAEEILGYPIDDWLSDPHFWESRLDPADRERIVALARAAVERGEDYELEYRMLAAAGRTVWLRDKVRIVKGIDGRPRQLRGVMLDVTQVKLAEEERARLSLAVEQAAEAIVITDLEGTITYVNPAFERVTGYSRAEALGQNPRILKSGKQNEDFYKELWKTLARGDVWIGRFTNRRKDGTTYEAEAVLSPVRDMAARIVNYVAVERDVTRERQLEEQVRQSQKIEAVGRLAGGVAHDFNNLLTIISGYSDLLLTRLDTEDPSRGHVTEIKKAADRAASLTRQLLAFSRRQVLAPQVLDLNHVVVNIHKMLRRLIGEDIDLVMVPAPDLGRVRVDPGQIEQVLLNLVVNARDAMPHGGKIVIETANVELNDRYAGGHFPVNAGPYVMLAVSDTGCGMDAETQSHIFEPFFTTKEQGKGTGLGLAMVYGIVKQSEGYIWVYSEMGQGTTFKIYFPSVAAEPPQPEAAKVTRGHARGAETILLVEDESSLRSLVRGLLEGIGYTVLEAPDAEKAIRSSEEYDGPIHMLLTDVVMPGMSGPELSQQLAVSRKDMKVLYMSGYADDAIVQHGILSSNAAYLQKPFTPEGLAQKIREVLDTA